MPDIHATCRRRAIKHDAGEDADVTRSFASFLETLLSALLGERAA